MEVLNYKREEDDIISQLIYNMENKLLNYDKVLQLTRYIENLNRTRDNIYSYSHNHLLNSELLELVEDYNNVINQSLQGIKSLQYENINLKELLNNDRRTGLSQNDNNLYERYLSTEEMRNSSRDNLFKLNYDYNEIGNSIQKEEINLNDNNRNYEEKKQLDENNFYKNENENVRNRIPLREKIKSTNENTYDIEIVKKTNNILKFLNENQNFSNYFGNRYSNGSYKDFLEKIINYRTDNEILDKILNDILLVKEQSQESSQSFTNFINSANNNRNIDNDKIEDNYRRIHNSQPKNKIYSTCADEDNISFEKILRNYNPVGVTGKKPFNRFTKHHGNYFDKKLTQYSNKVSTSRSRSKSK